MSPRTPRDGHWLIGRPVVSDTGYRAYGPSPSQWEPPAPPRQKKRRVQLLTLVGFVVLLAVGISIAFASSHPSAGSFNGPLGSNPNGPGFTSNSGNTGNTGSGTAGAVGGGAGNTGAGNTGGGNTGAGNTGAGPAATGKAGAGNTGAGNTGSGGGAPSAAGTGN